MTERQIQKAVMAHWKAFGIPGTLVAAIPNAGALGQYGLTRGLFDLLVIGGRVGVAFLELKTDKGELTPYQIAFRSVLIVNEVPYAVTHGREQPITVLEDWGIVRKQARAA
jgi:hypothetical protein